MRGKLRDIGAQVAPSDLLHRSYRSASNDGGGGNEGIQGTSKECFPGCVNMG